GQRQRSARCLRGAAHRFSWRGAGYASRSAGSCKFCTAGARRARRSGPFRGGEIRPGEALLVRGCAGGFAALQVLLVLLGLLFQSIDEQSRGQPERCGDDEAERMVLEVEEV